MMTMPPILLTPLRRSRRAAMWLGCALLAWAPCTAGAALVEVSFSNGTAVTASNVATAVGAASGSFNSGDGRVAIESILDTSLGTLQLNAVDDIVTGEAGIRWGVEADHCLGAGGCGGTHHFIEATGDLVMTIVVDPTITAWTLELGIQSFGNLNGLADGGTLPICTSDMTGFASTVRTVGAGSSAAFDFRDGRLSVDDDGDCTQDTSWVKNERGIVLVSGTSGGTFEFHLEQDVDIRSEVQTNLFAIKNGSDTCFRAGADPGDGASFFDACDYPGLVFGEGNRDEDGLLGNEPNDGGIWITDRVNGAAVRVLTLETEVEPPEPVPALGAAAALALVSGMASLGAISVRRRA